MKEKFELELGLLGMAIAMGVVVYLFPTIAKTIF